MPLDEAKLYFGVNCEEEAMMTCITELRLGML